MTPVRLTRQSAPVEAAELTEDNAASVWAWLISLGLDVELHCTHGLLIHADGPISVDHGQWVTVSGTGRVEVWDRAELAAEHDGVPCV